MHDLFSLRPQKDLEQVFTHYADLLCTLLSSDSLHESDLLYVADFSMALKYLSTPIPERRHVSFKMTENTSEQTAQTAERVLIRTLPLLSNIAQKHKEYAALNHIADALNIQKTFSEVPGFTPNTKLEKIYEKINPQNPNVTQQHDHVLFFSKQGELAWRFFCPERAQSVYKELLRDSPGQQIGLWLRRKPQQKKPFLPYQINTKGITPLLKSQDPATIFFPTYPDPSGSLICDFIQPHILSCFLTFFTHLKRKTATGHWVKLFAPDTRYTTPDNRLIFLVPQNHFTSIRIPQIDRFSCLFSSPVFGSSPETMWHSSWDDTPTPQNILP